ADRNRSHWSTSKTPSYTKSVSWQHHLEAGGIMMPGNPIKISGCADPHVMPGAATLDQHGEQIRQEFSS
ncbi:hypothetical protein LXO10_14850, partial [Escherichia coli]|nr:hypothetical protein [Escherichia coli]